MAKKVRIPTPLRKLTNNEELVEVNATTIGDVIAELQTRYPGIKDRLIDETGSIRRFVNVYVNEEDIRFLENQKTALKDGDEISIIPAIAGGDRRHLCRDGGWRDGRCGKETDCFGQDPRQGFGCALCHWQRPENIGRGERSCRPPARDQAELARV